MTTLRKEIRRCINCGCETEFTLVSSTNSFGPCDLDFRPAPMERETIEYHVQRCPNCNYANSNISVETGFNPELLQSETYLKVLNSNYPELAKSYMLASIISDSIDESLEAALYMINACWVLDDNKIDARKTRKVAAKLFEKANVYSEGYLIIIDLYRRAEDFDSARQWLEKANKYTKDKQLKKLFHLEEQLIDTFDSECHNCDDYKFYQEVPIDSGLKLDSYDEITRKLVDENSTEPVIISYKGIPTEFEQVGVFTINIDGVDRIFALLECPMIDQDSGFVFEIIGEDKMEDFRYVSDYDIIDKVFDAYNELLRKNNES